MGLHVEAPDGGIAAFDPRDKISDNGRWFAGYAGFKLPAGVSLKLRFGRPGRQRLVVCVGAEDIDPAIDNAKMKNPLTADDDGAHPRVVVRQAAVPVRVHG